MTRLILRLELDGKGVYHSQALNALDIQTMDERRHPPPYNDAALRDFRAEHYFGFAGVRSYLQWFYSPSWRLAMTEFGVRLCLYRVHDADYITGDKQLIFVKSSAQLVTSFAPDLFDRAEATQRELLDSYWEQLAHDD